MSVSISINQSQRGVGSGRGQGAESATEQYHQQQVAGSLDPVTGGMVRSASLADQAAGAIKSSNSGTFKQLDVTNFGQGSGGGAVAK